MATVAETRELFRRADAVCFDVDSTVIREEGIDELAKFCGVGDAVTEMSEIPQSINVSFSISLSQYLSEYLSLFASEPVCYLLLKVILWWKSVLVSCMSGVFNML